eukprot:7636941-Ditylum_brightwellii.AAC.1
MQWMMKMYQDYENDENSGENETEDNIEDYQPKDRNEEDHPKDNNREDQPIDINEEDQPKDNNKAIYPTPTAADQVANRVRKSTASKSTKTIPTHKNATRRRFGNMQMRRNRIRTRGSRWLDKLR